MAEYSFLGKLSLKVFQDKIFSEIFVLVLNIN